MSAHAGCELLSRLLHPGGPRTTLAELQSLDPDDWGDLLDQAEHHQITPLLHRALQEPERRAVVPAAVMGQLEISYFNTAAGSARIVSQLQAVLEASRAAGVPVLVLKGAHLAEVVYGDVTLRPMGDIDLLVKEADLSRAAQVLLGLGYGPQDTPGAKKDYSAHRHLPPFTRKGAVPIEVHGTIDESGRFRIDAEGLWQRAKTARIAGVEARVLGPEDLLLHLCLHTGFQHNFRVPLRQIYDIAATVRHYEQELDWQAFVRMAEASGLSRVCYYALAAAESLLGVAAPAEALTALAAGCDEATVTVIREYVLLSQSHRAPEGVKDMMQARGTRGRIRSLLRSIFPPPARLREIYALAPGSRAVYAYYPVRLWDLLVRRGGFLAQLASRGSEARVALDLEAKSLLIRRRLEEKPLRRGEARGR
ncbi:MAG TPA: nucleotidyltransferase family protein [Thermoanaerobaculia bacterium]|nr:nucleotidyltransferase family protein [Thermoanaerobaculia bacterium]